MRPRNKLTIETTICEQTAQLVTLMTFIGNAINVSVPKGQLTAKHTAQTDHKQTELCRASLCLSTPRTYPTLTTFEHVLKNT